MIVFMCLILGATGFTSTYGLHGLLVFLLLAALSALLLRARKLHRI